MKGFIYYLLISEPDRRGVVHHDIKANAVGCQRPTNQAEMISNIRSYLLSTQRQPTIVQRFFHEKHVAYAAT